MKRYNQLIRHKGNDSLLKMQELSIISLLNEIPLHIHVTGLRGTGKTTAIRAVKEFLPPIRRIKGCVFNCMPEKPHCPTHRELHPHEIEKIGEELVAMPFLEISHSAKIGTVVGSIDLEKITTMDSPQAVILPGTIPKAHRGIIFVDEINRLADTAPELADILLDVMGTKPGRIQIEETGLKSIELPVCVSVWAASNPDEEPGALEDIRKQISDRFDYIVPVDRPDDKEVIENILKAGVKNLYEIYPSTLYAKAIGLLDKSIIFDDVVIPESLINFITSLYIDNGIESIRGIESILLGARLHCALQNRKEIDIRDISFITPLALKHRISLEQLSDILKKIDKFYPAPKSDFEDIAAKTTDRDVLKKNKDCKSRPGQTNRNTISKISEYMSRWFPLKYRKNEIVEYEKKQRIVEPIESNSHCNTGFNQDESKPNNLPIKAPPNKALLIREHDADKIVMTSGGEKKTHDIHEY